MPRPKRVKKLAKKVERISGRVEAGTAGPKAEARLAKLQPKLETAAGRVEQRIARREGAGRPTMDAQQALGRAQSALGGVPNFTGAPPPAAGAPPWLNAAVRDTRPPPAGGAPSPAAGAPPPAAGAPPPAAGAPPPAGGAPPPAGGAPPGAPTFTDVMNRQFGEGNPFTQPGTNLGQIAGQLGGEGGAFQPLGLFGNPLETAQARAQNLLEQNLAQQGAQFGGMGLGNSSRLALTRGAAMGEAATNLGDILAQRGLQNRQADLDRLLAGATAQGGFQEQGLSRSLQAMLGAGQLEQGQQQLQQSAQQLALSNIGELGQQGAGLAGISAQEQQIPGLTGALGFLGEFGRQTGDTSMRGRSTTGKYI